MDSVQDFYMTKNTDIPYRIEAAFKVNGNDYVLCIDRHTTEGIYFCKIAYVTSKQKRYFKYKTPADIMPALATCIKILEASAAFLSPRVSAFCFALPSNTAKNYNRLVSLMLKKTYLKNTFEQLPASYEGASHKFLILLKRGKSAKNVFKGKYFKDYDFEWHDKKDEIPAKAIEDLKPLKPEKKMTSLERSTKYSFDDVSPEDINNDEDNGIDTNIDYDNGVENTDNNEINIVKNNDKTLNYYQNTNKAPIEKNKILNNNLDSELYEKYESLIFNCEHKMLAGNRFYTFICFAGMWKYQTEIKNNPPFNDEDHYYHILIMLNGSAPNKVEEFIKKYSYDDSFIESKMREAYNIMKKNYNEYCIFIKEEDKEIRKYIKDFFGKGITRELDDNGQYINNEYTNDEENVSQPDDTQEIINDIKNDKIYFDTQFKGEIVNPLLTIINKIVEDNDVLSDKELYTIKKSLLSVIMGSLIIINNSKYQSTLTLKRFASEIIKKTQSILEKNDLNSIIEYIEYPDNIKKIIYLAFKNYKKLKNYNFINVGLCIDAGNKFLLNIDIWKKIYNMKISKQIDISKNLLDNYDDVENTDYLDKDYFLKNVNFDEETKIYFRLNGYADRIRSSDIFEYVAANIAMAFNLNTFRNINYYTFKNSDFNVLANSSSYDKIIEKLKNFQNDYSTDFSKVVWFAGIETAFENVKDILVKKPLYVLGDKGKDEQKKNLKKLFERAFEIYKVFYVEQKNTIVEKYVKKDNNKIYEKPNEPYKIYNNDDYALKIRFKSVKDHFLKYKFDRFNLFVAIFGMSIGWKYDNKFDCYIKNNLLINYDDFRYLSYTQEKYAANFYSNFVKSIADGLDDLNPMIKEFLTQDQIDEALEQSIYVISDMEKHVGFYCETYFDYLDKICDSFYTTTKVTSIRPPEPAAGAECGKNKKELITNQKINIETIENISDYEKDIPLLENLEPDLTDNFAAPRESQNVLISQWMDKDKFYEKISPNSKNLIYSYTAAVDGINIFLRYLNKKVSKKYLKLQSENVKKIRDFNAIFNQAPITKQPFVVYRDCDLPNVSPAYGVLSDINKNIIDNGIISTTTNSKFVFNNALNTRLAILIPAGSRFVVPVFENSKYTDEDEILLPPASCFKPIEINVVRPSNNDRSRQYIKCIYTGSYLNSFVDNYFSIKYNEAHKDNNMIESLDDDIKTFKEFLSESEMEMTGKNINSAKWAEPFGDPKNNELLKDIEAGKIKFEGGLTGKELKDFLNKNKDE